MSPAQPAPTRQRLSRRQARTARRQAAAESEATPLPDLRRRCAGGAVAAGCGYLAILTTTAVCPTAMSDLVTVGLLIGTGTVAGLCALGAVLTWTVERLPQQPTGLQEVGYRQQAEDLMWAMRFGADMADAFRKPSSGASKGR